MKGSQPAKKTIVYNLQELCSYITYTMKPRSNKYKTIMTISDVHELSQP
jgi:hypothetical protein